MRLTYLLAFLMALMGVNAWHLTLTTGKKFCGKRRTFFSSGGENNCYNIPDDVAGKIKSGVWCTMPHTRCSLTLHDGKGCTGNLLGSSSKSWPDMWENPDITSKNRKARSFRVQGCKKILTTIDMNVCYHDKQDEPWGKC